MHEVLTASPFDRAALRRDDAAWLTAQLAHAESRFLPLWRLRPLLKVERAELAWARGEIRTRDDLTAPPVLLGTRDSVAHFALDVSEIAEPHAALGVEGIAIFDEPRAAAARLSAGEVAILGTARALLGWHATHGFCAGCGVRTRTIRAGWARRCDACSRDHFPRTDPVVIAVVVRGDRCLLGRQSSWPPGLFSALAGFVEPGETLEEAVRREVYEETSVRVGAVRYHSTQPWPFPHSLMIGCVAEALSDGVALLDGELGDARWVSRDAVRAVLAGDRAQSGGLSLPGPVAIAHHLLRWFAYGESATETAGPLAERAVAEHAHVVAGDPGAPAERRVAGND
jgi:NAD+ diphosphatase